MHVCLCACFESAQVKLFCRLTQQHGLRQSRLQLLACQRMLGLCAPGPFPVEMVHLCCTHVGWRHAQTATGRRLCHDPLPLALPCREVDEASGRRFLLLDSAPGGSDGAAAGTNPQPAGGGDAPAPLPPIPCLSVCCACN